MKIFVAGSSGFVGEPVVRELKEAGHIIIAPGHYEADVTSERSMLQALPNETEAIIYLPGLLREFPKKGLTFQKIHVDGVRNLIAAATAKGVRRWIQMSALGAGANAPTEYFRTKFEAEELVKKSGLEWTILRPSLIFDTRPRYQHNFVDEVADAIRMAPFVPILGNGNFLLQPIFVENVSQAIVQSLIKPETIGQTYELGGPETITYRDAVTTIAKALHSKKPAVKIPIPLISFVAGMLDRFSWFPITQDEITMLQNGNYVHDSKENEKVRATFTLPLIRFHEGVSKMLQK